MPATQSVADRLLDKKKNDKKKNALENLLFIHVRPLLF